MNFYVIKLKHIIIALLIFAVIPIIWFTTSRAVSVFNVNGREIPIYSVERNDNKIALTFDCAWNDDDIDSILDTLDKYNCKATFFVVGDWAEKYSESLKKIYDRGHEIGNHSYNHADYTKMSAEAITADLDKCDGIVESITGERPYLMRAPSGGYNNTVVKAAEDSGRMYIQWSVDGIDYGDNIVNPSSLHAASIFMSFPFKAGFGNLAKPDFTYLHSGNSAENFGGIGVQI